MKLYGEIVNHKVFGRGIITQFVNNYATILFDESNEEKEFAYPSAFDSFLELENKYLLEDMISFDFSVGGYFGSSNFIYIDGIENNKVVRYATTSGGLHVDLKDPKKKINRHPDIEIKDITLTKDQWLTFVEEINALELATWKDKYYDNDMCDGTQWNLVISFTNGRKISKCGSNDYPACWDEFIEILKEYVGVNIG